MNEARGATTGMDHRLVPPMLRRRGRWTTSPGVAHSAIVPRLAHGFSATTWRAIRSPAATDDAGSLSSFGSSLDIAKATLGAVGTVGEAIKPFVPLIAVVTTVIGEIIRVYEDAEYNKKICNALMDRVQIADGAIKTLNRRKQENEKSAG